MGAYLTIAFRNLNQAKRRSILLSSALAFVTLMLVLALALSRAVSENMIANTTALMAGHVNIGGFYKAKATDAWPMINDVSAVRKIAEENTPELDYVAVRDRAWAKVISSRYSMFVSPSGVDIGQETRLPQAIRLAKESEYKKGGRDQVFGDLKRLAKRNTALIFAGQAKRLEVDIGDYLTVSAATGGGRTNTLDVTVAAIAKDLAPLSNWNMFIPMADVHSLYQIKPDSSSVVMVYLKDPDKSESVMGHLREVFKQKGYTLMDHQAAPFFAKFAAVAEEDWTGQKLDLTTWIDEVSFISWITTTLDSINFLITGILMVIIAIGIMNSMWISVRERTREVGTMRAIGMTRSRVLFMFLSEALLLGFIGTTVGTLIGASLAAAIDSAAIEIPSDLVQMILMSDVLHFSVSPLHVVNVIWIFTAITGLSALWPAMKAARMQPVTAIQHAE